MNNFRLTGIPSPYYISKEGNDANSGLTPDLPKATLANHNSGGYHIIGTGVYKGAIVLSNNLFGGVYMADGLVKILATGNIVATANDNFYNTYLNTTTNQAHTIFIDMGGFSYVGGRGQQHFNCVFTNGSYIHNTGASMVPLLQRCVMDCDTTLTGVQFTFSYCQFFNGNNTIPSLTTIENSYIDYATVFSLPSYFTTPSTQFFNNCFNGKIVIGASAYELKKDKSGTLIPDRIGNGVLDLETIDATVYTRGNFSQDPEFLNISKRDYWSVSSTSPLLFAASNPLNNIGNVRYSVVKKVTDTEFVGGTITDLITLANDYVLQTPATSGQVVTLPIQIAPIPQVLDTLNFARALNFNSDITLGDAENNNVTIIQNYADGTAGANPRRLTYEMRWSNQSTQPTLDAHWDNNGYGTAGNYFTFEQDTIPKVSFDGVSAFYGNGSPEYDVLVGGKISAKWVQFRVKLLNGIG